MCWGDKQIAPAIQTELGSPTINGNGKVYVNRDGAYYGGRSHTAELSARDSAAKVGILKQEDRAYEEKVSGISSIPGVGAVPQGIIRDYGNAVKNSTLYPAGNPLGRVYSDPKFVKQLEEWNTSRGSDATASVATGA